MESSEGAKDSATEEVISEAKHVVAEAEAEAEEEKGSESSEARTDQTTELPVSDVKDVSIEFVESKQEVGDSNLEGVGETSVIKRDAEVEKGSETETSEAQESVPTTSLPSHEDNYPTVDTTTTTTTTTTTNDDEVPVVPAPILENRASMWNCCGLLDVFKGSQR